MGRVLDRHITCPSGILECDLPPRDEIRINGKSARASVGYFQVPRRLTSDFGVNVALPAIVDRKVL